MIALLVSETNNFSECPYSFKTYHLFPVLKRLMYGMSSDYRMRDGNFLPYTSQNYHVNLRPVKTTVCVVMLEVDTHVSVQQGLMVSTVR